MSQNPPTPATPSASAVKPESPFDSKNAVVSTKKPQPITDLIPIDEAKLNDYPAWQRAIRRAQMEQEHTGGIERAKLKDLEVHRLQRIATDLRLKLKNCGITLPESAKPEWGFEGYRWSQRKNGQYYLRIEMDVPEATEALSGEYWEAGYRLSVYEELAYNLLSKAAIADALDTLQEKAEAAAEANANVIARQETESVSAIAAPAQPKTRTKQRYAVLPVEDELDRLDSATELEDYLKDGWSIAYQQFATVDDGFCHCVYLEKTIIDDNPTSGDTETSASAAPDLSAFEAALSDIPDTDDSATPSEIADEVLNAGYSNMKDVSKFDAVPAELVKTWLDQAHAVDNGGALLQHLYTRWVAGGKQTNATPDITYHAAPTAIDLLLEGKPIAQAILEHGVEATKAAMNHAIAVKINGNTANTPQTFELPAEVS